MSLARLVFLLFLYKMKIPSILHPLSPAQCPGLFVPDTPALVPTTQLFPKGLNSSLQVGKHITNMRWFSLEPIVVSCV